MLLRFWFSKVLSNKISLALILKHKSCVCCRKHCRAYFRRHMECAVLKSFWGCRELFRKSSCNIHFPIEEKLNLILFIKTLIKGFTPHPLRFAQHLLPREGFKTLPSSYACHLPFQGRLSIWEGSHERGAVT